VDIQAKDHNSPLLARIWRIVPLDIGDIELDSIHSSL
jgi:hypothetical protein